MRPWRRLPCRFWLGALASPAAAGVYNVALLPVTVVLNLLVPVRFLLLPEQARLAANGDFPALRKTVRGFTGIALALAIPAAVAGWFLLPVLLPALFSSEFASAVHPAQILLLAAVFQLAIGSWSKLLPVAICKPRLRSIMSGAYMAISVALAALLAPSLGSTAGTSASTGCSGCVNSPR